MKGIFNSFYQISAALTMCLGVCVASADQAPNPRSATTAKVASPRTDAKVISRGDGQNDRVSAVASRGGTVSARTANASTVRSATGGAKTSYVRSAIKNVVNPNRSGASVARSGMPVKSNVARSGAKVNAAKQARSAASTVSMAGMARAASTARATAVFNDISKIGGGYSQCRDSYATCMDQFCANANDTFRRCFCSSRFTEFRETEEMLDQVKVLLQRFEDNNLNAVDKTAAEVNAMYTATVGEAAIKNDVSGAQSILNEIGDLLSGKKKASSGADEPAGLMNISFDLDMDNLWGSENSLFDSGNGRGTTDMSQMEGIELYNTSNKQCLEIVKDSCQSDAVLNMATSAYNIMITQDCNLYEKKIDSQKQAVEDTVRQAEKYLREARLDEYRAHNSQDVNECITKVKDAMGQDMACGENYKRCLDFTGRYVEQTSGQLIYSKNLYELTDEIVLDGSYDVLAANKKFDTGLESKKMYAEQARDSCRDKADIVWNEYKRTALIEIAQAQDAAIEEVKSECVTTMRECYDSQTGQLKEMDTTKAQVTGAIAVSAARTMCAEKVSACAALYGNGKCQFNGNRIDINSARECGIESLIAFVDTVDAAKIGEACTAALSKYVNDELCAPASGETDKKSPWGCRNLSKDAMRTAIESRYKVYCPDFTDDPSMSIYGDGRSAADALVDSIAGELDYIFDTECTKLGGYWLAAGTDEENGLSYLSSRVSDNDYLNDFYTAMKGGQDTLVDYGTCYANTIKLQCELMAEEKPDDATYAVYDANTNQCKFGDAWYKEKCEVLDGYWVNNTCYYKE